LRHWKRTVQKLTDTMLAGARIVIQGDRFEKNGRRGVSNEENKLENRDGQKREAAI